MRKRMLQFLSFMLILQLSLSSLPAAVFAVEGENESLVSTIEQVEVPSEELLVQVPEEPLEQAVEVESEEVEIVKNEEVDQLVKQEEVGAVLLKEEVEPEKETPKSPVIAQKAIVAKEQVKKKATVQAVQEPKKKKLTVSAAITENILSNPQFLDKDGKPVTTSKPMSPGDELTIKLDWALDNNHAYKNGDTFTFQLPEQLLIASAQSGSLVDDDGTNYGSYTVDKDGLVIFTFSEEIELNSDISGTFTIKSQLDEDLSGSTEQELVVDVPGAGDISQGITITPTKGSTLTKSGVLDKPKDPTKVTWTIDVNKKLEQLGPITISDVVPAGLEFIPGSIKVYELNMNIDGTSTLGPVVPGTFSTFPITLNDGTKAYRITFETKITEKVDAKYVNKATMTSDGKTTNAEASVSTQYSKPMAKSVGAYDPVTQQLDWTVNFNQRGDEIAQEDAYFIDYFSSKLELVPGSLKVEVLSYDSSGNEVWTLVPASEYTVINNPAGTKAEDNGFKLQFNDDIDQAYRITYKTEIVGEMIINQTVTNTVEGLGQKPITIKKPLNNTYIVKEHGSINYEDKTIPWTLTINEDAKNMTGIVITENFTNKGLSLIESSISVKTASGTDIPYTLENEGEEGFKLRIPGPVSEKFIVKYKTNFDTTKTEDGRNTYSNRVSILGKYDGKNFAGFDTESLTPGEKSQNNGYKSGDYSYVTKLFTWKIGVNYNKEKVNQLVVEDVSPEGLKPILSSFKVYKLNLSNGGEGVRAGEFTDFTVVEKQIDGKPGFVITFNVPIEDAYQIVYDSEDADGVIEGEYTNEAVVKGTFKESELYAKVPVLHGGELAVKSGKQEEDVINWQVQFNFSQSSLSNATLVDTPSANQFVLKDSFHVYKAIPDAANTGKFIKGEEISATAYEVTIAEDGSFKLEFKDEIEEGYYIEYQSYINAAAGEYIENEAWAESDQMTSKDKPTKEKVKVVLTNSSASGTGETGSLTIYKVDAYSPDKFLPGTEFVLWALDKDGNKKFELKTAVTDEDGKIVFEDLLYKEYVLEESKASSGYKITLAGESEVQMKSENIELTVENEPINPTGQLAMTKVSEEDGTTLLPGATFNLLDSEGNIVLEDLVTDANGKIEVSVPLTIELDENGDPITLSNEFTLVETKAPEGYELLEEQVPVSITYGEITDLTVENASVKEPPIIIEPQPPTEPTDPKDPTDPEEPKDSTDPTDPESPLNLDGVNGSKGGGNGDKGDSTVEKSKEQQLPQTGVDHLLKGILSGFLLLSIGVLILVMYRKRTNRTMQ